MHKKYHFKYHKSSAAKINYSTGTPQKINYKHYDHWEMGASIRADWINLPDPIVSSFTTNNGALIQVSTKKVAIYQKDVLIWKAPLQEVKKMSFEIQRLILPMLLGGILSPLLFLALFKGIIYGWLGIFISFMGLLLFYYGWQGKYQLVIYGRQYPIMRLFIDDTDHHIQHFIKITQNFIHRK